MPSAPVTSVGAPSNPGNGEDGRQGMSRLASTGDVERSGEGGAPSAPPLERRSGPGLRLSEGGQV